MAVSKALKTNLSAAAILAACIPPRVEVQALGGVITLQGAAANRDAFEAMLYNSGDKPDLSKMRLFMISACIIDEDGNRLFTTDAELKQLGLMPRADFEKIAKVAGDLLAVNETKEAVKKS